MTDTISLLEFAAAGKINKELRIRLKDLTALLQMFSKMHEVLSGISETSRMAQETSSDTFSLIYLDSTEVLLDIGEMQVERISSFHCPHDPDIYEIDLQSLSMSCPDCGGEIILWLEYDEQQGASNGNAKQGIQTG